MDSHIILLLFVPPLPQQRSESKVSGVAPMARGASVRPVSARAPKNAPKATPANRYHVARFAKQVREKERERERWRGGRERERRKWGRGNTCTFTRIASYTRLTCFPSCLSSPASLLQGGFGDEERNAIRTAHGADDDHQVAGGVSPVYGPPEVLNDEEQQASPSFPKKWDVYSYAALMYEVFAGEGYFQELKVRMKRKEEETDPPCRVLCVVPY